MTGPSRGRPAELPDVVGVVDVGGGSTEIAVGTPLLGAAWLRSADLGSLRLTRAHLHDDPPTARQLTAAMDAVARAFERLRPPRPDVAFAVGGSASALARIVGRRFDADDLVEAAKLLSRRPAAEDGPRRSGSTRNGPRRCSRGRCSSPARARRSGRRSSSGAAACARVRRSSSPACRPSPPPEASVGRRRTASGDRAWDRPPRVERGACRRSGAARAPRGLASR